MYYIIWSIEHGGWWKDRENGYTKEKAEAGVYHQKRAFEIIESANINDNDVPNEALVPVSNSK